MSLFSGLCCRDHQVLHGVDLKLFEGMPEGKEVYIFQMWRGEGEDTPVDCPYIKFTPFLSRDEEVVRHCFDLDNFSSPHHIEGEKSWLLLLSNELRGRLVEVMGREQDPCPWCQVVVGHFGDSSLTYVVFRASSLALFEVCQEWVLSGKVVQ